MRTEPGAIDLGAYHVDSQSDPRPGRRSGPGREPGPGPPWPGWVRLRRFWARLRQPGLARRRWSAVAMAAAVLLVVPLAGDVPPVPPRLVPLWTVPDTLGDHTAMAVGAHRLYLLTNTGEGASLVAHRLADGRVAWRASLGGATARYPSLRLAGSIPVLTSYGATERTIAFHPETGRWLWSVPGVPAGEVGGGRLLVSRPAPTERQRGVAAVDLRTGRSTDTVWVAETAGVAGWRAPDGAVHVVTLRRDGLVSRHPLTREAPVATVRTPHRERLEASAQNTLSVVGDRVLVADRAGGPHTLAAYDAATLQHRWTVPLGGRGPTPCGPVLCVVPPGPVGSEGLAGVDLATGTLRWSVTCADGGVPPPCQLFPRWVAPDRLWVESSGYSSDAPVTRSWVVDAGTGRRVSEPTEWSLGEPHAAGVPVVAAPDTGLPVAGTPALGGLGGLGSGQAGDPESGDRHLLLTRAGSADDADGADGLDSAVDDPRAGDPPRIWFARADPALTEVTVLGAWEAHLCTPYGSYLVCWTARDGLEVVRMVGGRRG